MSREIFSCDKQRAKDVQNFIFTGCNVVRVIKETASVQEEIQTLQNMKKKLEHKIDTIKDSMIQYAKVNGRRSKALDSKLNEKEEELNKLLTRLQEKKESLKSLQTEYDEYMNYITNSPYSNQIYVGFYKYIVVEKMTKDEFLTVLMVILTAGIIEVDRQGKTYAIADLINKCHERGEEEYKRLADSLKSIKDIEDYIKGSY